MVQKTVKLLIFLNHNLVGFKNTRTFVLKEKGRFFGATVLLREEWRPKSEIKKQVLYIYIIHLKVLFYEQKVFYFDGSGDARRRTVMQ